MGTITSEFLFVIDKVSETLETCVVAGGVARQIHLGEPSVARSDYPDVDFTIRNCDSIPSEICNDFYISHYHPNSSRGKLVIQLACKETFGRIDIFSSKDDGVFSRSNLHNINGADMNVLSAEDLQLNLIEDLIRVLAGRKVNSKYFHYLGMLHEVVDKDKINEILQQYGECSPCIDYESTYADICRLWKNKNELFVKYEYSKTIESCPNCVIDNEFPLVDKNVLIEEWGFV